MSTALAIGHMMSRLGGYRFSPSALFAGGTVPGAWYDPSDLSTMFDTSAGTTPVAMPGQGAAVPVGLMLDKSQGLVLGSELVTNGDFSNGTTGWTAYQSTLSVVGGKLRVTATSANPGAYQAISVVSGKTYEIVFTIDLGTVPSGNYFLGNTLFGGVFSIPSSGTYTYRFVSGTTNAAYNFYIHKSSGASVGQYFDLDNISVRELPGNHAISFNNTTARPELRARVNSLTYSEQFDNAAWVATNATKGTTTGTRPDGTTGTVHSLTLQGATTSYVYQTNSFASGQTATFAIYVRLPSGSTATDVRLTTNNTLSWNTGISQKFALTSSWQRLLLSGTVTTTGTLVSVIVGNTDAAGNRDASIPAGVIEIWGADLRPANIGANVPAYQRIADANTYDTSGFPLYLRFDGIDDSMYTPANLDLSGTNKVAVFAGVRKNAEVAIGQVFTELSSSFAPNNGSFGLLDVGAPNYTPGFGSRGTATAYPYPASGYSAPLSMVLTGIGNIAAPLAQIRANGSVAASSTASQGTGNYGTYPLYIGARNNSILRFNGHLYSLVVAGSAVSAGNISATEQWVAGKTGIQI